LIEVSHLTKKYGDNIAVNDLSFTVEKGKIYGFLGPNGAGKSTTMNIITGCLAADSGTVKIDGHDIFDEPIEAKRAIGYLPEIPPLYTEMSVYEYLRFVAEAKGVDRGEIEDQIKNVMAETEITDKKKRLIRNLSKGYKQRVGIAQAMLGNPEVIILDEPTVGLDPKQIIGIRELISSLGETHTVILSSHILSEIAEVCDYVLIIAHGNLVASDTIENLSVNYTGKSTIKMIVKAPEGKLRMALDTISEIEEYSFEQPELHPELLNVKITIPRECDIREKLWNTFVEAKCPVLSLETESLSLEDVFLMLTRDPEPDELYEDEEDAAPSAAKACAPTDHIVGAGKRNVDEDGGTDESDDESDEDDGDKYTSLFTISDEDKTDKGGKN